MGKICIIHFTSSSTGTLPGSWLPSPVPAANDQDPGTPLPDKSDTQSHQVDTDTHSSDQFSDASSAYSETESEYERQIKDLQYSTAQHRAHVMELAKDTEELVWKCNTAQSLPCATNSAPDSEDLFPNSDELGAKLQQLEKEVALDEQHYHRQKRRFANYSIRQKNQAKVNSLAQSVPKGPKKKSRRK